MGAQRHDVVAVIVGTDEWKKATKPFVESLKYHDPKLRLLVVANGVEYPPQTDLLELPTQVSYSAALNAGMDMAGDADWYICFNNDCLALGPLTPIIPYLNESILYGSGWNVDYVNRIHLQWSAWLAISRRVRTKTGEFDPELDGGFEDFDYEVRAVLYEKFGLDTAPFPVMHLGKHSRLLTPDIKNRWEASRQRFELKHRMVTQPWL